MAIKNFIKENFVLCLGLALPIVLVILFLLSSSLPRHFATPPEYKLILADYNYSHHRADDGYNVKLMVENGTLKMRLTPARDGHGSQNPHLLIYDGKRDSIQKIDIALPDAGVYTKPVTLPVQEAADFKIDTTNKAPDGYAFLHSRGGGGGIVTGVFGGGYRHQRMYVKKGMASFKLPQIDGYYGYYGDDTFIGWVVDEK